MRHKHMALKFVLACLAPWLAGTSKLAAMKQEEIVAAENKCKLEEGGADMLERPPETFREAVLPDHVRYKAQFAYKVRTAGSFRVVHVAGLFRSEGGQPE